MRSPLHQKVYMDYIFHLRNKNITWPEIAKELVAVDLHYSPSSLRAFWSRHHTAYLDNLPSSLYGHSKSTGHIIIGSPSVSGGKCNSISPFQAKKKLPQ